MPLIPRKSLSQPTGRPPAAVELTPLGVLAAALPGGGAAAVVAFEPLPAGALAPGINSVNFAAPDAVAGAIRKALDQVEPRKRSISVILPDTSVRVFVLDFDSLPAKPADAISVLRFRLRKMVPFDVEHAGVSYQTLAQDKAGCRVLAAIIPAPILAEYEAAVHAAAYEPGAILPASLAALATVDAAEPVLAACLNEESLTTAIAHGNDLLLYRTLDLPAEPGLRLAEVQRDIAVAAAYFEDKLSMRPTSLRYAGRGTAGDFARWIGETEMTVVDLAPRPEPGAATALGNVSLSGVTGALAGVA